ncbi:MAG: indolepyruvate ferredoxin oxidoreductase subunit alpha [Clostridia bacterium]|jgi:indolepyruvate ferredoxin oxidoreductase alpha subunit|nr:indolepyruvate ferredoxin oxidoreductase subunit alpha [Clostridia bacterium]MDH7573973.1 indolepyruvate ferredoxin oxidoreductase subunit alpha [Clostridia bacterium]
MPKQLMSGNEAIAYGAYLAGVRVAAAYPGTPSTEILENLARYPGVYAEWAPNEKVAADVAAGAAYAGRRALAAMKHVGLNVAAETLFYTSYTGIEAGLVLVTCDDPGMHSSQNEQDNRHYARFAKVPMLEPADSEEAKQFTKLAFAISERFDTPVLVRSTTRISHSKSPVEREDPPAPAPTESRPYRRDPAKYVMVPAYARKRHPIIEERLKRLAEYFEELEINRIEMGDPELGIIAAGVACQYAREVFPEASFLKLGTTWPLPEEKIRRFAAAVKRVLVVEELDPFLEEQVRLLGIECRGKSVFPAVGELSPGLVRECARKAGLLPPGAGGQEPASSPAPAVQLPPRPPMLCPGCGHRPVFYALRLYNVLVFGDIGCYGLGVNPPLNGYHTSGCMGASIGVAHGADHAGVKERRAAIIGDSTFFHAGIPPLIDVLYNRGTTTVIVLDNRTTAMTGHQDHPGTGRTLLRQETVAVAVEDLARAVGFRKVDVVDPFDFKTLRQLIREHVDSHEPSVLVARHPCVLLTREYKPAYRVDPERCNDCGVCRKLGCAPLIKVNGKMAIDPLLCVGCGFCAQVCGRKAIVPAGEGGDSQ